ncbi:hypothetical protein Ple7327_2772 [Pleurocapsa sp. PCC 7327]|uniref:DUF5615 family PIN-like protein n=1 Tax=Pleurocapsa sp. PCC 7327 TaxID=118163 RepID=UPI00029FA17A|nr:hypothetical protein Ple7327_2772 [Pleurocapsa sp. PCC 7327]
MKLLLDQGLPRSAATLLSEAGIDTVHVAEIGLSAADDRDILQRARDDERVVVTLDADFHALLALSAATSPSVIRIRIERLRAQALTNLLLTVLDEFSEDLEQGVVVTVEPSRVRMRRLPLVKEG